MDVVVLDDPFPYKSSVGALQYCAVSRLDITFSINKLCQFLNAHINVYLKIEKGQRGTYRTWNMVWY